jgi:hypothetical protein
MTEPLPCFGALALETATPPAHLGLARDAAQALAQHVADDLQRLLPEAPHFDLAFAALHYDPAELLRPGWPVHAALAGLAARAPGAGRGRLIAFGLGADGSAPLPALVPEAALQGGPLRLLPFVLLGDADRSAALAARMEDTLLETGMAGAATALEAQQALGTRLEHARYLTLHDLCAMTALQYEHAGLAPLWPAIEAVLLGAGRGELWLDAPPEPLLRYRDGEVRLADCDREAWQAAGLAPADAADERRLAAAFHAYRGRLRQFAAVLAAHGIAAQCVPVRGAEAARARLAG